ncbi:hypothetical protein BDQ94DRAFT_185062 [Aspergillus welwitschiae]|uniref:Zn(2)-C6 fungal-type domain-containing protein n=1 Tax=Aspergillus welwitschiae TaxID=1341132 RepID=A0A3F3PKJ2_9EURO|nr:hypothetical protein BDQ94DRAFT_185062 [Aspergillus welwitschiae]RDH27252.1 hypothetical protein BDQ94DRAFT_185062 [Aspergillus welwitschiae]
MNDHPHPLPKSVKVRSTCNACQQAKIRCSHEKPACRRCQKHNIDCVYSISRRLGRPAKKKDADDESDYRRDREFLDGPSKQDSRARNCSRNSHGNNNSSSNSRKRRMKLEDEQETVLDDTLLLLDKAGGSQSLLDPVGAIDPVSSLPGDCFLDGATPTALFADSGFDLFSDSWVQEFIANPPVDLAPEGLLLDSIVSSVKPESTGGRTPVDPKHISRGFIQDTPLITPTTLDNKIGIMDAPSEAKYLIEDPLAWSLPFSAMDNFPTRQTATETNAFAQAKMTKRPYLYGLPAGEMMPVSAVLAPHAYQFQCHEYTIQESFRQMSIAIRMGPYMSIDHILHCQRMLLNVSDTILKCCVCCITKKDILMVVVVNIDSLMTNLEAITTGEAGHTQRLLYNGYHEHMLPDCKQDVPGNMARRYRSGGLHFRSQIDACPLVVGKFCVQSGDKFFCILQILYSQLSDLLSTVKRINLYTQESSARISLTRETERRLEEVMLQMKRMTRV